MAKSTAVVTPNLGIYYDRAKVAVPSRALQDGLNFRVKNGVLSNLNLGWTRFGAFTLNGPVMLIINFIIRGGSEQLVFGTTRDLYRYDTGSDDVVFITPRYETGTAAASGTAVTGTGTTWSSNAKAGDFISFGAAGETDPAATWFEIDSVGGDTSITLTADAGTVVDGPYTIRKVFTGSISDIWSADIFVNASPSTEDELWMTNGIDDIVRWNGTDDQVEIMSALGFTAKALQVYSNMMIFGGVSVGGTELPTDFINSNVGEPQNVSSGLSEQFKAHGGTDAIVAMMPIGDYLAIYSYRTVTLIQFVGDPLIFIIRQVMTEVGPLGPRAIANFGNYHEFLAADGQYYFDGATVKEVNSHFWREVLRQQDPGRIAITYSHFDEENGDLIWVMPSTLDPDPAGGPSLASAEHYLENPGPNVPTPFSRRSFPFTATGFFQRQTGLRWSDINDQWQNLNFRWNDRFFFAAFPLNMAGNEDGEIYTFNTSQDADGAGLASFVTFGRRALFDGRVRGLLTRVYPFVSELVTPIDVTVNMQDSADGGIKLSTTLEFDQLQATEEHFVTPYRRGRFFEVKFSSAGPGEPWEVAGYDVDARGGGSR